MRVQANPFLAGCKIISLCFTSQVNEGDDVSTHNFRKCGPQTPEHSSFCREQQQYQQQMWHVINNKIDFCAKIGL